MNTSTENNGSEKGTVKWYNTAKGFGFIVPESGGSDVFVHSSEVIQSGYPSLREDDIISFRRFMQRDGRESATDLVVTSSSTAQKKARKTTIAEELKHGTVKWFNSTKGFGFIKPQAGGKDVFIHISAVERSAIPVERLVEAGASDKHSDGSPISYYLQSGRNGQVSAVSLELH